MLTWMLKVQVIASAVTLVANQHQLETRHPQAVLCAPVAFACKVVGFVMPLTEFADDDTMINLMHPFLNFRPEGPIWQPVHDQHDKK